MQSPTSAQNINSVATPSASPVRLAIESGVILSGVSEANAVEGP